MLHLFKTQEVTPDKDGKFTVYAVRCNKVEIPDEVDGDEKSNITKPKTNWKFDAKPRDVNANDVKWLDESAIEQEFYTRCCDIANKVTLKRDDTSELNTKFPHERGARLLTHVIKESREIAIKTRLGSGDVMVMNKAAKELFDSFDYSIDSNGNVAKGLNNSMFVAYSDKLEKNILAGSLIMEEYDDGSEEPHVLIGYSGNHNLCTGVVVAQKGCKYALVDDIDGAKDFYTLITLVG